MVNRLKTMDDDTAKKTLARWMKDAATEEKRQKYSKEAKDAIRAANPVSQSTDPGRAKAESTRSNAKPHPTNPTTHTARVSLDLACADGLLAKAYPNDPIIREGMLECYRAIQSETQAEASLQSWTTDTLQMPHWKRST
jgi:hypothetical protein